MRTIALHPSKKWASIWEVIKERDCDPNPETYSLRTMNGSLHHKYRSYKTIYSLIREASEDYEFIQVGNHILNRRTQ